MARNLYALTDADRRRLQDMSRRVYGKHGSTRPVATRRRNTGGSGGGSGVYPTPCMVYDDIEGATSDTSGLITLGPTVRLLPIVADEAGWRADLEADFITGKVWSLGSLPMGQSGCGCDDETEAVPSGILITPGMGADGNDRIYDSDANSGAVVVSGTGVAAAATITVSITDGTTTLTPTVTNNGDGTWDAASQSLSTLDRGPVKVSATDGATTDALVIVYSGDDSPTELAYFTGRCPKPDLVAASDLGVSDTDNITSDTTPTFSLTFGGVAGVPTGEGPYEVVYNNGEPFITDGDVLDFQSELTIEKTVGSNSPPDPATNTTPFNNVQGVNILDDSTDLFYGPPSLPLRYQYSSGATEETEPPKRYARLGYYFAHETMGNLVTCDICRREITDDEATKLDA